MAYGTLNAGAITPGSGNTLTISETVSLTGNATLGGTANALGTVTAGNISHANIVYPVGHVIQTTTVTTGTTETDISGTSFQDTVVTGSITPLFSTSSIIVHVSFKINFYNTSGDGGCAYKWKKVHSGGTSYPANLSGYVSGDVLSLVYLNPATPSTYQVQHDMSPQDSAAGVAGSAVTYTMQAAEYNLDDLKWGGCNNGKWTIWFQEIKR
tara:strand:+ start:150 stop:782 length:633 start_codon:yes stop_codon:yes gene_type:complete